MQSAVLEKMTLKFAIFCHFPEIPELNLSFPFVHGQPDGTSNSRISCRVTIPVLFVNVKTRSGLS